MIRKIQNLSLMLALVLISTTAVAQEINVYSYREADLVAPVFEAFTAETGIKVNVSFLQKGLTERLHAEGDRSPADLVMTTDISRLNELVLAKVVQPVHSDILEKNIPAKFRDPQNQWFGLTSRARVIYASKDRVQKGEVTSYEDLISAKWKGRVCTRSGTHSYNLGLTAAIILHHGEEAAQAWLTGVKNNLARKPQGNDRAQIKAIFAGECDISIGNTYYMGLMLQDEEQRQWAQAVNVVFARFENGGTHVNLSGVAMTKAAPHKEEARQLMEFLSSKKAQEIYAETNYEYPLIPGGKTSEVVASWGELTPDTAPLIEVAKLRGKALDLVEMVGFDE